MLFSAGTSHTKVTLQLIPCGLDWQAILCGGDRGGACRSPPLSQGCPGVEL